MTRRRTAAVLVAAALALAGCAGGSGATGAPVEVGGKASTLHGTELNHPYPLPDQQFTDTGGHAYVPSRDATAPVTLVYFGYSHCTDVCNIVLANVAAALRRAPAGVRHRTQLVFVTTDPARDSRSVLRSYLDRFDPGYVGLRADQATMMAAAASMHIAMGGRQAVTGGGYEVDHGTQITAFQGGRATVIWSASTPVSDLRADLVALATG